MAPLQNPGTQSSTRSTQFLLGSSQPANLRLALDLLPKRAGLKLTHPQALAPGHLKRKKKHAVGETSCRDSFYSG